MAYRIMLKVVIHIKYRFQGLSPDLLIWHPNYNECLQGCNDKCNDNAIDCSTIPDFSGGENCGEIAACENAWQKGCESEALTEQITAELLEEYTMNVVIILKSGSPFDYLPFLQFS